jgi:cytidylate kinase
MATNGESGGGSPKASGEQKPPLTIAIDGPAAAGKSTIGRAIAEALDLLYLDTGTMYRAVAWLALRRGIDPRDEAAVTALASAASFSFPTLGRADRVNPPIVIDGLDATNGIREPEVDASVSLVASYAGVRAALVREQQALARERGVVMVGRDIGTVVLPQARLKIYLTAGPEERARRRFEERRAQNDDGDYEEIYRSMLRRDQLDSERAHSPLRPADDAVLLDSTGLSIEQVAERAIALARAAEVGR